MRRKKMKEITRDIIYMIWSFIGSTISFWLIFYNKTAEKIFLLIGLIFVVGLSIVVLNHNLYVRYRRKKFIAQLK